MQLLLSEYDFNVTKLKISSSFAGLSEHLTFKETTSEDIISVSPLAKSLLLITDEGSITQVNAMLRYIASKSTLDIGLKGKDSIDQAQVDQWLEYSYEQLEVPIKVLLGLSSGKPEFIMSVTNKFKVEQQSRLDIAKSLRIIEGQLEKKTFIATEYITIADISIFSALLAIEKYGLVDKISYPSTFRWFKTLSFQPKVSETITAEKVTEIPEDPTEGLTDGKWSRHRTRVKNLLDQGVQVIGKIVTLKGWVRTSRTAEKNQLLFVELNDGSCSKSVQLVLNATSTTGFEYVMESGGVHAAIEVKGLVLASPAKGQTIEVSVNTAHVLGPIYGGENGEIGGKNYPMAKKQHTLEFLREKAHLRPRSKVFSAAMRIRHAMAFATHKFFNDRGFVYTHTPLITGADCEGAGEQFAVTTLLPEKVKAKDIPVDKNGLVDFSKDFFSKRCCLTVSGQLNVETHASALSDVYTFGPTFRAEESHTSRHLAEFWMIEPEICFADLADDMALAEDYVKFCTSYALEHCAEDLSYFENDFPSGEKGLRARLENVVENDFAQITYTEGVEILQRDIAAGIVTFEKYPNWGDDLGSEHERYIAEKIFKRPTIMINYPKGIKAFYMKVNDDDATVAAMDILVPKIGELIGGSQREDRLEVLERRVIEMGLKPEDMWWYLDLRRYGSVPHAGFGLGFERLIMFITGLENIRDVIPFPRYPGHSEF